MARWQNFLAIIAMFFAAGALLPWSSMNRMVSAGAAGGLIVILMFIRIQEHTKVQRKPRESTAAIQARIDQIREDREKRFGRR